MAQGFRTQSVKGFGVGLRVQSGAFAGGNPNQDPTP